MSLILIADADYWGVEMTKTRRDAHDAAIATLTGAHYNRRAGRRTERGARSFQPKNNTKD
jgi:hypothetical protein